MIAFAFLNPALLWLLPLVAVPIVIHLLNRRRYQRVKWAAMEFLLAALRRNRRRLQMQQWLLLLLRALAVLFLVLLVTRPQLGSSVFGTARTHHVICLDDSLSMRQRSGARDVFAEARDRLLALGGRIAEEGSGHVLSIVTTDAPTRPVLAAQRVGVQTQARVREVLGGMPVASDGSGDLAAALRQARELGASTPECSRTEITLLTDLRQVDWIGEDGRPRADLLAVLRALDPTKERLRVVALGGRDSENLAVAAVRVRDRFVVAGVPATFAIDVANRGLSASAPGELTVRIGRGEQATQRTFPVEPIAPGVTTTITLQHTFRDPGDQGVVASLARDAFAADDLRALAVSVRATVRCLLVDGDPGQAPDEAETYYLATALDPDLEVVTGVEPVVVPDQALETESLEDYDIVWLCNVPAPSPAVADKLRRFVAGGGGLVVFTGNQVDPQRYNEVLGTGPEGLLPLPLDDVEGDVQAPRPAFLADEEHPLFAREAEGFKSLFAAAGIGRYHPSRADAGSTVRPQVLVGDARGPGLLVAREPVQPGHGRVVVIGTTADEFWSSLPVYPRELFPPLCAELCAWTARAQDDGARNLGSRDVWREPLDGAVFRADVTVRGEADGDERTFTAAGVAEEGQTGLELVVPMAELRGFGLFTCTFTRHAGEREVRMIARNPPLREGELLRATRTALQAAYPADVLEHVEIVEGDGAGSAGEAPSSDLARALALGLVLILLLESLLAWRASR